MLDGAINNPMKNMIRLTDTLAANCFPSADFLSGEIYHVRRPGVQFGAEYTLVARYFATHLTHQLRAPTNIGACIVSFESTSIHLSPQERETFWLKP
jgi:hypothetical protein